MFGRLENHESSRSLPVAASVPTGLSVMMGLYSFSIKVMTLEP